MKFDHSFKHHDVSQALMSYVEERLRAKVLKYEIKPGTAHITYSIQRHRLCMEVHLSGGIADFQAHYEGTDWHIVADQTVNKLLSQMKKVKNRVKYHKHPEKSKEAKLELLSAELEAKAQLEEDEADYIAS